MHKPDVSIYENYLGESIEGHPIVTKTKTEIPTRRRKRGPPRSRTREPRMTTPPMKRVADSRSTNDFTKKNGDDKTKMKREKPESEERELKDCPARNLRYSRKRDEDKVIC